MRIQNQPNEKKERNQELIADHQKGMSVVDMVVKYRISPQRIYAIIRRHNEHKFILWEP
jgi:Mor family transcriptional regulator